MGLVMYYLGRAANQRLEGNPKLGMNLRMHRMYAAIGWVVVVFGLVISILCLVDDPDNNRWIAFFLLAIIGGLGGICLLFYYNHRLDFDKERIGVVSWTGSRKELHWEQVTNIRFNGFAGYLILEDKGGTRIKISQHMVGLRTFVDLIEEKTNRSAKSWGLPL
ncbi:MAG: hypothetical protein AAFV25_28025 [Bacteroidota bacterium]